MSAFLAASAEHDPLPTLLALHNRADARLTAFDAAHMRASVLAASFARGWTLLDAAHRRHTYRELTLASSHADHIILPVGRPLRVRLGFDSGFGGSNQEGRVEGDHVIVIPRGMTTRWLWHPQTDEEKTPVAEFLHLYLHPHSLARVRDELDIGAPVTLRETLGRVRSHPDATWPLISRRDPS